MSAVIENILVGFRQLFSNTLGQALVMIVYVLTSSLGLYKIKEAGLSLNPGFLLGFFLYGTGFLIWLVILKMLPLSVAFPIAASSLIIATQIIGALLLGEQTNPYQILGIAFILVGVCLVHWKSGGIH